MRAEPRKMGFSDNKGRDGPAENSQKKPGSLCELRPAAFAFELISSLIPRGSVVLEAGVRDRHEMFAVGEAIIFTMPERQRL
jgi:hypothetical protein